MFLFIFFTCKIYHIQRHYVMKKNQWGEVVFDWKNPNMKKVVAANKLRDRLNTISGAENDGYQADDMPETPEQREYRIQRAVVDIWKEFTKKKRLERAERERSTFVRVEPEERKSPIRKVSKARRNYRFH